MRRGPAGLQGKWGRRLLGAKEGSPLKTRRRGRKSSSEPGFLENLKACGALMQGGIEREDAPYITGPTKGAWDGRMSVVRKSEGLCQSLGEKAEITKGL